MLNWYTNWYTNDFSAHFIHQVCIVMLTPLILRMYPFRSIRFMVVHLDNAGFTIFNDTFNHRTVKGSENREVYRGDNMSRFICHCCWMPCTGKIASLSPPFASITFGGLCQGLRYEGKLNSAKVMLHVAVMLYTCVLNAGYLIKD